MTILVAALAVAVFAVLFVAGVAMIGVGALAWSHAIKGAHEARYAGVQANVAAAADAAIQEVADEKERRPARAPYHPPSEHEIAQQILMERAERGEVTTDVMAGAEPDEPPIMPGGMYVHAEGLDE